MMDDLLEETPWNVCDLKPPRIYFDESSIHLKKLIRKAIVHELSHDKYRNQIYIENIALSKFLNQRGNKYRNDKGFQTIQKVDKAVNRIYQLDLPTIFNMIKLNLVDTFVPSKQLHQWLLIKLQSYAKLLDRTNHCCFYSATMLNHRLHTGHNWVEVMIALSMISRMWAISKFLLKEVCSTYKLLRSVLQRSPLDVEEKEWPYLNSNLPKSLEKWLSLSDCETLTKKPCLTTADIYQRIRNDAKSRKILKIQSHEQLKKFLKLERKKRSSIDTKDDCISKNLNASQWRMLTKKILKWVKLLKKSNDQNRNKLLTKIKLKMIVSFLK